MHFEIYRDAAHEWRWTLYASNGRKVADSGEGYHNKPSFPYPDLVSVKIATRNAIAEKVDAGKLTEAEGELAMAQANSKLASELKGRLDSSQAVAAQSLAAVAAADANRPKTCYGGPQIATCF